VAPAAHPTVAGRISQAQRRGSQVAAPAGTPAAAQVGSPAARADSPAVARQEAVDHRMADQEAGHRAAGREAAGREAAGREAAGREAAGHPAAAREAEVAGSRTEVLKTGPAGLLRAAGCQAAGCPAPVQRGRMADSCRLPRSDPRRSLQVGDEYAIGHAQRAVRFRALMTPRSDASTIDALMPTPHNTRSPTSISRYAAASASRPAVSACSL
jgi:hypothetical protein